MYKRQKEDIDKQRPLKTYYWKIGEPFSKAKVIGTTKDAKNSFFIYDNRYSDVTFSGESDFYANSLHIKKTGTAGEGRQIYKSCLLYTSSCVLETGPALTTASIGQPYSYPVVASDPDAGEELTGSLVPATSRLSIHAASGLNTLTPSEAQEDSQDV